MVDSFFNFINNSFNSWKIVLHVYKYVVIPKGSHHLFSLSKLISQQILLCLKITKHSLECVEGTQFILKLVHLFIDLDYLFSSFRIFLWDKGLEFIAKRKLWLENFFFVGSILLF